MGRFCFAMAVVLGLCLSGTAAVAGWGEGWAGPVVVAPPPVGGGYYVPSYTAYYAPSVAYYPSPVYVGYYPPATPSVGYYVPYVAGYAPAVTAHVMNPIAPRWISH